MSIQELKDRFKSESPAFFKKVINFCLSGIATIGVAYGSIATLEATGYYTAPEYFKTALAHISTWLIATMVLAKFTKVDNQDKIEQ